MMEQIKLDRHNISVMQGIKGESAIAFKGNPVLENIPLIKLYNIISGNHDYFKADQNRGLRGRVQDDIKFDTGHRIVSFRKNMRRGARSNPMATLIMSMLSVLGAQGNLERLQSKIGVRRRNNSYGDYAQSRKGQRVFITNPVEVFILAMIKPSDLVKINLNDKRTIDIDPTTITLFLSEEKYKTRKYLNENYNGTVARHLRKNVDSIIERYSLKVEVVPDEVLKQYYTNPYSIENNSIFEIMEIDKNVKDRVFSRINEHLEIVE